jgi:hypothetical protein
MENEIAAGTKVKVAITSKGVTSIRDAEVLAHMDGLIHLNMDGEAVSVDPSQIVPGDAPVADPADPPAPAENSGSAQMIADVIAGLTARLAVLETLPSYVSELHARIDALEAKIPPPGADPAPEPAPAADPVPAPALTEQNSNEQASTAAADAGGSAAGS